MLDRIDLLRENEFQSFCSALLCAHDPTFQVVDGSGGDLGNDGFCIVGDRVFQAHGPTHRRIDKLRRKIDESLAKAIALRESAFPELRCFVFLTPFDLTHQGHVHLQRAASQANLVVESWGQTKLASLLAEHPEVRTLFPNFLLPDVLGEVRAIRDAVEGIYEDEDDGEEDEADPYEELLGADYHPQIYVLQKNERPGCSERAAYEYVRLRLYSAAFGHESFEPKEEDAFRDVVRRAFWEDSTAELEAPSDDRVLVEHRHPELRFHRRWGWWTSGALGMAATLPDLLREGSYSVADVAADMTRFLHLASRLRKVGDVRVLFGIDPGALRPTFDPSGVVARERLGVRLGGVRSVARPSLERTQEITIEHECNLKQLAVEPHTVAGKLLVTALRHLHQARIDSTEFASSIPPLIDAMKRAASM